MNQFTGDYWGPQQSTWADDHGGDIPEPSAAATPDQVPPGPEPDVSEATEHVVSGALSEVEAASPAAAAATEDALARAGQAVAISHSNHGDNTAIKIINNLQESLERFQADDRYLAAVLELFAPPAGFRDSFDAWMDSRLIVVALDQDQGRFITAHALLATIRKEREVNVGALSFGGGSTFPVSQLSGHRNWAYVVEVPAEEEEFRLHSTFGSSLHALQHKLHDQDCWVVMLMSVDQWNRAEAQASGAVTIRDGHVEPQEIALRALRVRDSTVPADRWLSDPRVGPLLAGQCPAEVQEIVEFIVAAHRLSESELDDRDSTQAPNGQDGQLARDSDWSFSRRVDVVVSACTSWRKKLLDWHRASGRTSFERNFLISAAVQKGAPVAHVYMGATELAEALNEETAQVASTGQNVPGVIDLVDAVQADLTDEDTVAFHRVGWDDAALQYFWVDRPLSRGLFLGWLAARAVQSQKREALESLSEAQRRALASRIASLAVDWAVRQKRSQPLTRIAEEWYGREAVWSAFIDVLDHAAVQPSTARSIHPMLLTWANATPSAKQPGKLAVAEICAREFGKKYTGKAFIRLKHAANSDDVLVIGAVRAAVQRLWEDETVRHALFDAVIEWCGDDRTAAAGRESFHTLALAGNPEDARCPWLLIETIGGDDPAGTIDRFACGWCSLLAPGNSDAYVADVLFFWLEAAATFSEHRRWIVDVLCRAAQGPEVAGQESARNRLTGLVRQWSKRPSDETTPREELYALIAGQMDDDFMARRGVASASPA